MRFDKEARASVLEAAPGTATIRWPAGEAEPEKDRVYRMQSAEELADAEEKAKRKREAHPETHAEVMAQMHRRRYGKLPDGYEPPKRKRRSRPRTDDPRIRVVGVTILQRGWEATVELYEHPDPPRHLHIKTKVPAGPDPIDGRPEKVELEPEQILIAPSRSEREDEEESLRVECIASADRAELGRLERKLASERRKGKSAKRTQKALERARRRVEQGEAEVAA